MNRPERNHNPQRLQLLRSLSPPTLNGIEYLEVASADQRTLRLVFVHPVAGLTAQHLRISGGVRVTGIRVTTVTSSGRTLQLTVDTAGDFSGYQLLLVDPADPAQPPPGFDPVLSSIRFSFKAQCPSEFDCRSPAGGPAQALDEPLLDYLAKDYASFRRLMLDRMSQLIPGGQARHPADFSVALVELLAHVGDQLSDYQDAVATEAYLGTARQRVSLRRHARLLDYPLHEGNNSRVFVTLEVNADGAALDPHTPLLAQRRSPGPVQAPEVLDALPDGETEVFLSLHAQPLRAAQSEIRLHTWGDSPFCLPQGSTSAVLVDAPPLGLTPGAVLILEETASPVTGLAQDADRGHRQAVRILRVQPAVDPVGALDADGKPAPLALLRVDWHEEDALTFPLCVSAPIAQAGRTLVRQTAVARGNVVLADHGRPVSHRPLEPATVPAQGAYRPRLPQPGLAFAQDYAHARFIAAGGSARAALQQQPRDAVPAGLQLLADDPAADGEQPDAAATPWKPIGDLLGSDRFAQRFVVETEHDGSARLRFGDDRLGASPPPGQRLLASYRVGGGPQGNVGAEAIGALVSNDPALVARVRRVRNPLPAVGGQEPEPAAAVKLYAPEALRIPERAVTAADHARMAERHPQVQRAAARLRWTGSWYTLFLSIDRRGGKPVDAAFEAAMRRHLAPLRLTGYDLEIEEPAFVPLHIALTVCVLPGYFAADVKQQLLQRFSRQTDAAGRPGFFAPDHFSFGDALPLSRLLEAAMSVAGVASVEVDEFQRHGKVAAGEIQAGILRAGPLEVLRLDNDPDFPEHGRLVLRMRGGT